MSEDALEEQVSRRSFIPVVDETDSLPDLNSWYTEFERVEALRQQAIAAMEKEKGAAAEPSNPAGAQGGAVGG